MNGLLIPEAFTAGFGFGLGVVSAIIICGFVAIGVLYAMGAREARKGK